MPGLTGQEVIAALAAEPCTAVFVNRAGEIVELVPVRQPLTPERVGELSRTHQDLAFTLAAKRDYTEGEIREFQRRGVEAFDRMKGPLRPGVIYF